MRPDSPRDGAAFSSSLRSWLRPVARSSLPLALVRQRFAIAWHRACLARSHPSSSAYYTGVPLTVPVASHLSVCNCCHSIFTSEVTVKLPVLIRVISLSPPSTVLGEAGVTYVA